MKIFIDPGHGGTDPGAVNEIYNIHEADINLSVALQLGQILESQGFTIQYSRTTNVQVTLSQRARLANDWKADYFISIHCNFSFNSDANGTETFYYQRGTIDEQFAISVQNHLVQQIHLRDRGVLPGDFAVLQLTTMPAILVELAFISNLKEACLLHCPSFQNKCAVGIANGLSAFTKTNS